MVVRFHFFVACTVLFASTLCLASPHTDVSVPVATRTTVDCPLQCDFKKQATTRCNRFSGCRLVPCNFSRSGKRYRGLSCMPVTMLPPAMPRLTKCPNQCKDPSRAKMDCARSIASCVTAPCPSVDGKRRIKCTDMAPPAPAVASTMNMRPVPYCPNRCTDLDWATKDCMRALVPCEVVNCTLGPLGYPRYKCASKVVSSPSPAPSMRPLTSCPNKCMDPVWARKDCMRAIVPCEIEECPPGPKGFKMLKCGPKASASPSPAPSMRPLTRCPNKCMDPVWARKDCMRATVPCKIEECPPGPKGFKMLKCGPVPSVSPTPTPSMPPLTSCPNKCMDPVWARKDCMRAIVPCKTEECPPGPKGFKMLKCASDPTNEVTSTVAMPPLARCPNKCTDPEWARKDCMRTLVPCEVVDCTPGPKGFKRVKCAPKATAPLPCPNKCADRSWAVKECMTRSAGCEVTDCAPDRDSGYKPAKCGPKRV